ncbi:MAG: hypothetical protein WBM43_11250 [Flavobacteriaceae bacterium]
MKFSKSIPWLLSLLIFSCGDKRNTDTIKSYIATHNAHDVEAALGYYQTDAVFELKGVWTKKGLDEIRGLEEFDAVMNSHLELKDIREAGDTIYCKIVENNDWFGTMNIANLVHDPVIFVMRNNKFKHIIGYPDQQTGLEIEAAMGLIFQWSAKATDSVIYELLPNGAFVYSTEAGHKWKALFERMQKSDSIP